MPKVIPAWQTQAELRLQRLEAQAGAARAAAQEIYQGELVPTKQSGQRIAERIKHLQAWRPASQSRPGYSPEQAQADVDAELASLQAQAEQIAQAVAEIGQRRNAADAAARTAGGFANRAREALRKATGTTIQFNGRDGFTASAGTVTGA